MIFSLSFQWISSNNGNNNNSRLTKIIDFFENISQSIEIADP